MNCQNTGTTPLTSPPTQFGGHVPQHLVEGGLTGAVGSKPILVISKEGRRARVGGYKDHFCRGTIRVKIHQFLSTDDRPDGVGM